MTRAKTKAAVAAVPAAGYPVPLDDADHAAVARLLVTYGASTPDDIAAAIHACPYLEAEVLTVLHGVFGNSYAAQVAAALERLRDTASDHTGDVKGRADLSSGAASASDPRAVRPGDQLPFDGKAGWDAITINRSLGQYDLLAGTDSDGARCGHATALAIQVLNGPASMIQWMKDYTRAHEPEGNNTPKQNAACDVLIAVIKAIESQHATYGDLSWAQEALHDYTIAGDGQGTPSSAFVTAGKSQEWTAMGQGYTKAGDVVATAGALDPGEQYLCAWRGSNAGGNFDHQFMIANHDGALYLYDSEIQKDGAHMRELTKAAIKPYVVADTDWIEIHGKVSPRAPAAKKG